MESQVEQIREQLIKQPYEDVYSAHFARKEMTDELYDVFLKAFDANGLVTSEFNSKKINLLKNWFESKDGEGVKFSKFPSFFDFYICNFYRDDGLKYNNSDSNILVLEKAVQQGEVFEKIVQEYESNLMIKHWWSEQDDKKWKELRQKRDNVDDFERYILDFEIQLDGVMSGEYEYIREHSLKVCIDFINLVKHQIARIKLFQDGLHKIPMLERLLEYFMAARSNYENYDYLFNNTFKQEENEVLDHIIIKLEDQEKFVYCSKLGVIKYLKEKIIASGVSYTDSKLYPWIRLITGNSLASIKKLMSFHNNTDNINEGNPFKDPKLMERVNRNLVNNNLI